jgi:hypothetical protein
MTATLKVETHPRAVYGFASFLVGNPVLETRGRQLATTQVSPALATGGEDCEETHTDTEEGEGKETNPGQRDIEQPEGGEVRRHEFGRVVC